MFGAIPPLLFLKIDDIKRLVAEKKAIYDYEVDRTKSKWLGTTKLKNVEVNLLPEYVFSNLENTIEKDLNHYENIHDIKLNDNEFDYCVAHACIHHSSKPHLAILELYRVCSKGSLIIEANDSLLSRIACKYNLSEEYELSAVKKK